MRSFTVQLNSVIITLKNYEHSLTNFVDRINNLDVLKYIPQSAEHAPILKEISILFLIL